MCLLALAASAAEIVWRPEAITFSLESHDPSGRRSQHLVLNQMLSPGATGWVQMKLDLPNSWKVSSLAMRDGAIEFAADSRRFRIGPDNIGSLSFAILDGAPKRRPDSELARIWLKFASMEANRALNTDAVHLPRAG